jgi:hypothetical protein
LAFVILVRTLVLWLARAQRARMGGAPSSRAMRGYRVHTGAAIVATVGFTWFAAWLITDATGPHWLHSLSLPATAVFLASGVILAGYAGWTGGP